MSPWWRDAVCYEVYVRSFADADGDGTGDLAGIRSRIGYLAWLGVDAIWITPFYPSPGADHGYDVSDPREVDPLFGTLEDYDALVHDAHAHGIRVLVDVVPNHVSDHHPWFQAALRDRDDPHRDYFVFRDPAPGGGPPNNWASVFGGPAWTLHEPTGQYYLHLFAPEQPDLNWRHPDVHADLEATLRFWLDRGTDGFRIDVAHSLYKDAELRDNPPKPETHAEGFFSTIQKNTFDQEEVHDVYRAWRRICDDYPGDRTMVGEVFLYDPLRVARYVRPDELHMAFNFLLQVQPWDAACFRDAIDRSFTALGAEGATCTWVLSSHDSRRHATRYGGGARGRARAHAAALVLLGLPGTVFLYQGEELGLEDVDIPDALRQDPVFHRTGGERKGRDGCRVPIPWEPDGPGYGFSPSADLWLPAPPDWGERAVSVLREDPGSILHLYRRAIAGRKQLGLGAGELAWLDGPDDVVAFAQDTDGGRVVVACNMGEAVATVPVDATDAVLASGDGVRCEDGRLVLPPDTAAWVRA